MESELHLQVYAVYIENGSVTVVCLQVNTFEYIFDKLIRVVKKVILLFLILPVQFQNIISQLFIQWESDVGVIS